MELNGEQLAFFRVYKESGIQYKALAMDADQKIDRRSYMRQVLKKYQTWANRTNETLDDMRLYRVDTGYIVEDEKGAEFYLPESGITQQESTFRRVRAMMPFEFMELTGKDFNWSKYRTDVSDQKDTVNRYILNYERFRDKGMGLYIYSGTKGSGKTMLSCCLLNEISKRYPGSVKFINTLDFLEMTKKGFKGEDETKPLYDAGLLVIDDIGVQMSSEWAETVFYRLINDRYINRKPTIYTSNTAIDRLKMDDRITDRIESTTYLLQLPEESVRRQARQQEKQKLIDEIENAPHSAPTLQGHT